MTDNNTDKALHTVATALKDPLVLNDVADKVGFLFADIPKPNITPEAEKRKRQWRSFQKYCKRLGDIYAKGTNKLDGAFIEKLASYWTDRILFGKENTAFRFPPHLICREMRGLKVIYPKEEK